MVKTKISRKPRFLFGIVILMVFVGWGFLAPQSLAHVWLTPDQQGRLLFHFGAYERAAHAIEEPHWRGMSQYAAQDFSAAVSTFSQLHDAKSLLAHANALAHTGDYVAARQAYFKLAQQDPDHPALVVNIPLMEQLIAATKQDVIDRNKQHSDGKKPGNGSQAVEDASAADAEQPEQLGADQLLGNPALTDMWLRQIQRDPSEFLTTKFYLQLEQAEVEQP